LQGPFIDAFYNNYYNTPNTQELPDPTSYFLNDNRVLGVARLRQIRVITIFIEYGFLSLN